MTALRVVEIVRRMEQGRTRPFLVRTEDDALYVAKGRTTTRQGLCAEWLCAHLGRALDLPIPPFALLDVSPTLLGVLGAEAAELGAGIAFGSRLEPLAQELMPQQVPEVAPDLRRLVLAFDWWLENADRTLSAKGGNPNLLWRPAQPRLLVIDHNLAFDAAFDEALFFETHVFRKDAQGLFDDWVNGEQMQQRLRSVLPAFDGALASLPEAWHWVDPEQTVQVGIDWNARRSRLAQRLEMLVGGPS